MNFATLFGLIFALLMAGFAALHLARRRQRRIGVDLLLAHPCRASLHKLQPALFFACIYELLRREGHAPRRVRHAGRTSIIMRTARGKSLVQCRYWTGATLADNELGDIVHAMRESGVKFGVLITAGEISEALSGPAQAANVELVDGTGVLRRMLAVCRR